MGESVVVGCWSRERAFGRVLLVLLLLIQQELRPNTHKTHTLMFRLQAAVQRLSGQQYKTPPDAHTRVQRL